MHLKGVISVAIFVALIAAAKATTAARTTTAKTTAAPKTTAPPITTAPPSPKAPAFGGRYHARGRVQLPYAELDEPFEVFYDGPKGMGRIDFYNGLDKVYYRGDQKPHGVTYKISPSVSDKGTMLNPVSCFQINGTKSSTVMPQTMLPDLTNFVYGGSQIVNEQFTDVWMNITTVQKKTNKYYFYVSKSSPAVPVRYEMFGFDSLLGSHYDKYIIDYSFFDNTTTIPVSTYDTPKKVNCTGFPGPGIEHHIVASPYRELVNPEHGDRYHQMFREYKAKHGKEYATDVQHEQRRMQFVHNVRFIHGVNRQGRSYKLEVNHLADHSQEEFSVMRGRRTSPGDHGGEPFSAKDFKDAPAPPASIDWRLMGAVSQVKDQAVCGSCWSFGSAEAIEGAYFVKNKKMVRFSQQNLMDCSWGYGNNGCDGGEEFRSYQWIIKNKGLMSEEDYGPYLGQNGKCHYDPKKASVQLSSYVNVTGQSNLTIALANVGPVAVGIDAHLRSFSFYSSGVYYDKDCGNKPEDLDHAVLAVGYGTMTVGKVSTKYWIVKNSWSTYWGNNGYVLISQKNNNCGVATDATYVKLA